MKTNRVAVAALIAAVTAPAAFAQAVQWRVEDGGNGHWYAIIDRGVSDQYGLQASIAAQFGARIAALGTEGEYDAVLQLLAKQMAMLPTGAAVLLNCIGYCFGDCAAYWHDRSALTTNWSEGEPSTPDFFVCALDPPTQLLRSRSTSSGFRWVMWEWSEDCDASGVVDFGEIRDGLLPDADGNHVPDQCDVYRQANHVLNGGFEANPVNQCCTSAAHWTGGIDLVVYEWFADTGGVSIDLNTGVASSITQSIAVAQAGTYRLAFAMAGNECGGSPQTKRLRATIDTYSEEFEHVLPDGSELPGEWSVFERSLYLPAGTHSLKFQSLIGGCGGPAVDSIALHLLADCNGDGVPDIDQIRLGVLADVDQNGVPDCCDEGVSCDPCLGDVNNDGIVNGADISVLLGFWGLNGKPVAADINQYGSVDGADLAQLLGSWGQCQ